MRSNARTRHKKHAETDANSGRHRGFDTPTGKIEIYSTTFASAGYPPLPKFEARDITNDQYPLTLTFFRDIHFCDEQHRNVPRLRRAIPDPKLEIHPSTASAQEIKDGDWIFLETATGRVKLQELVSRYEAASGKLRASRTSAVAIRTRELRKL